jgi:hypothetical protein
VSIASGDPIDEYAPILMALQLSSSSGVVDPDSPSPPPIDGFDNPLWTLDFSSTGLPLRVEGTIETLMVPEPTGLLLSAIGLAFGSIVLRRQQRAKVHSRKPNLR